MPASPLGFQPPQPRQRLRISELNDGDCPARIGQFSNARKCMVRLGFNEPPARPSLVEFSLTGDRHQS